MSTKTTKTLTRMVKPKGSRRQPAASTVRVMTPAEAMRDHAADLLLIPSGEQYISTIQSVLSDALGNLANWMDGVDKGGISRNVVKP